MTAPQVLVPIPKLAAELNLPPRGVSAVVELLSEGATVPFIARYRKEATGDLDEVQIRAIRERHAYLTELEQRRLAILESIESQGLLSDELRARIQACETKTTLEDLYLPYRPKRRTRATIARERGLEPLAELLLRQPSSPSPAEAATPFVDAERDVADVDAALAGARDIIAERLAEDADLRAFVRDTFAREGVLTSVVAKDKVGQRTKFEQYYDFREPISEIPSHRFLAVRRGEREDVLKTQISVNSDAVLERFQRHVDLRKSPYADELRQACADAYKRLMAPSVENDVRVDLKLGADRDAVAVFAENLRNLLLSAPLGERSVIGIDPGLRTGCKCAAVDATGKYLDTVTIYPHRGAGEQAKAAEALLAFVRRHKPFSIAVGNGTAGRDTEAFVRRTLKEGGQDGVIVVLVSESGASVYSASDVAREEFPDIDLTIRGAISIARRLQDPLAELVKIDPKSIGVGQYQHDVNQRLLKDKLEDVVESCVNHVGVQVNTASVPLLGHVAGIGLKAAKSIVQHRETHGAFAARAQLLKVAGIGPRTYEQAAGFLRVRDGAHPLDASAVHTERYKLVERIARDMGVGLAELVGNAELAGRIEILRYCDKDVGEPTLRDIVDELKKPGRDPRDAFEPPQFREDVNTLEDLAVGMALEGAVTNVTHFGAFVDIGVKQDGLVHISQLADRFVRDPSEVVKVGDKLQVRVLELDLERKRISLTCRSEQRPERNSAEATRKEPSKRPRDRAPSEGGAQKPDRGNGFSYNPFADLLKK
ncbi:MAG: Tex family protein [bacterium]